jgi:acyl-coenzyme A thioesterase PaaI-like protein
VTPFGVESLPIYVDSAVLEQPQVVMGGGNRSSKVLLAPRELLKLPGVTVVEGLASLKPRQNPPNPPSLQEQFFPTMACFGCGPANPKGLRIRSFAGDGGTFARFTPWPEHDNGLGFLNGGIICTLMDCHSATPMMLEAQRLGTAGDAGMLPYVTAGLEVKYLRPTPLDEELQLWAQLADGDESAMTVSVELSAQGKVRAVGRALWKPWRPRS